MGLTPMLLIAGQRDGIVPPTMSRVLTAAAAGPAELWIIPGADHNSTYLMGGAEYGRRFRAFVSRATASPPEP